MSMRVAFIIKESDEFSDEDLETLALLQHDKRHIGIPEGQPVPALEKALRIYGEKSSKPLFRGLLEKVDAKVGAAFGLRGYSSFSEDKSIADAFSKSYKSDTVLEVQNAHGFNYMKWVVDGYEKMRREDPKTFDSCDGQHMIDSATGEAEWILSLKSKFHVTEIREGHPTVIVARMD